MQALSAVVERYFVARQSFFRWRYNLAITSKIMLSVGMACVTGLLALIRIQLPFTPVPITGQVLGVLLSGVVCGGMFGSLSQVMYVGLGMAGIPWFAGGVTYSIHAFCQPTGGYLIGFMVVPFVIGRYTDRYISARSFLSQIKIMMAGVGIIYLFGGTVFSLVTGAGIARTFSMAVAPFILIDFTKAVIAAGVGFSVLPKTSYNGEIDRAKYMSKY